MYQVAMLGTKPSKLAAPHRARQGYCCEGNFVTVRPDGVGALRINNPGTDLGNDLVELKLLQCHNFAVQNPRTNQDQSSTHPENRHSMPIDQALATFDGKETLESGPRSSWEPG